jgi:predicted site-specific integrase-resolvase
MKSKEVLRLLNISRVTLMTYLKTGKITATKMANGYYDYDEKSVFSFLKKDVRHNVIYARVSTHKQKKYLNTQISLLKDHCDSNNISYSRIYKEISSGTDLDRSQFSLLMNDVFNYKIKNIYITYKDRLTRLSFKTIEQIFSKFGTTIIAIHDTDGKSYESELFDELLNIIHHFSTKTYSKRTQDKFKHLKNGIDFIK